MRHIRQELRLAPIRQFSRLPGSRVLLYTFTQVVHHLIDLRLERVHLTARLDSDEPSEIAVHSRRTDLCETAHLRGQVSGHGVDSHSNRKLAEAGLGRGRHT